MHTASAVLRLQHLSPGRGREVPYAHRFGGIETKFTLWFVWLLMVPYAHRFGGIETIFLVSIFLFILFLMHTASAVLRRKSFCGKFPSLPVFLMHTASAVLRRVFTLDENTIHVPYAHRFGGMYYLEFELGREKMSKKVADVKDSVYLSRTIATRDILQLHSGKRKIET